MATAKSKPLQLSLFPIQVRLTHAGPDANWHQFYLLRTLPPSLVTAFFSGSGEDLVLLDVCVATSIKPKATPSVH